MIRKAFQLATVFEKLASAELIKDILKRNMRVLLLNSGMQTNEFQVRPEHIEVFVPGNGPPYTVLLQMKGATLPEDPATRAYAVRALRDNAENLLRNKMPGYDIVVDIDEGNKARPLP